MPAMYAIQTRDLSDRRMAMRSLARGIIKNRNWTIVRARLVSTPSRAKESRFVAMSDTTKIVMYMATGHEVLDLVDGRNPGACWFTFAAYRLACDGDATGSIDSAVPPAAKCRVMAAVGLHPYASGMNQDSSRAGPRLHCRCVRVASCSTPFSASFS